MYVEKAWEDLGTCVYTRIGLGTGIGITGTSANTTLKIDTTSVEYP